MKTILIIIVLALSFLAPLANAQTLKAVNYDYIEVRGGICSNGYLSEWGETCGSCLFSVTLPSTKDPKWTVTLWNGDVCISTNPMDIYYSPKKKTSDAGNQ